MRSFSKATAGKHSQNHENHSRKLPNFAASNLPSPPYYATFCELETYKVFGNLIGLVAKQKCLVICLQHTLFK